MAGNIFSKAQTMDGFITEKADVIKNSLLGDYDSKGEYFISPKIINELLVTAKVKKSTFNNAIYCVASTKNYGTLTFEIMFKKNSDSKIATATMSLLENVKKVNGYILNTIKTPVGRFTSVLTPDFITKACEAMNVSNNLNTGSGNVELNTDLEDSYLNARKVLMVSLDKLTSNDYNLIYKKYFNERLALIKEDGSEFCQDIAERYELEYSKIEKFFLQNNAELDYKALNELLDKIFEDVSETSLKYKKQEKELKEKLIPLLNILIISANNLIEKAEAKVIKSIAKKDQQKAEELLAERQATAKSTEKQKPQAKEVESKTAVATAAPTVATAAPAANPFANNSAGSKMDNIFQRAASTVLKPTKKENPQAVPTSIFEEGYSSNTEKTKKRIEDSIRNNYIGNTKRPPGSTENPSVQLKSQHGRRIMNK